MVILTKHVMLICPTQTKCPIQLKHMNHFDQGGLFFIQFDYMFNLINNQIGHCNQIPHKSIHVSFRPLIEMGMFVNQSG